MQISRNKNETHDYNLTSTTKTTKRVRVLTSMMKYMYKKIAQVLLQDAQDNYS
jgi:hypothetical protein